MSVEIEKQELPLSQEIAERGTILRCEVGSTVHGIAVPGTEDRDELGICIEPKEYVIGLRHFEQYVHRSKPQGVRSEHGDLDLTIYGFRKFASLALKGNPSILLLFNVPTEKCSIMTPAGAELRRSAWAFASKRAGAAFLGYMQQQRQRLMGKRGQMNVKRPELVEQYGYDVKYAAHILRLGFQGIDYMTSGAFPVPMTFEQRELILAVRQGQIAENEVLTKAGELEADLKTAIDSSPLPNLPDYALVNDLLVSIYQRVWAYGAGT